MAIKRNNSKERALPSLALICGYIAVKELQRPQDRIAILDRLGYGIAEIATISGTTPAAVRAIKSDANKTKIVRRLKRKKVF